MKAKFLWLICNLQTFFISPFYAICHKLGHRIIIPKCDEQYLKMK